jgi:muramoyltetrapeptide carboxypeptidase
VKRLRLKPPALTAGSSISVIFPASAPDTAALENGCKELRRLGYHSVVKPRLASRESYFAGETAERVSEFLEAANDRETRAIFCGRGGYGSNYLMESVDSRKLKEPKIVVGYSDITSLQAFLWRKRGWVTFYGPMAAAGLNGGADQPGGYDSKSFVNTLTQTSGKWSLELKGEMLATGETTGTILGGCLTLVETTLGTPWELDTTGSILLLEDRAMKPYQVDRSLVHLKQAGKFDCVRGIVLGEFPECAVPPQGGPSVVDVCKRILTPLRVPIVWGAPIGHTSRAMLTVPLGVRGRLRASGSGQLEVLEPAVIAERAR